MVISYLRENPLNFDLYLCLFILVCLILWHVFLQTKRNWSLNIVNTYAIYHPIYCIEYDYYILLTTDGILMLLEAPKIIDGL